MKELDEILLPITAEHLRHETEYDNSIHQIKKLMLDTLKEVIEEPTVQVLIQVDNNEYLNGGFVQTYRLLEKLEEKLK